MSACGDCRFWKAYATSGDPADEGHCRRRAPVPRGYAYAFDWPVVRRADWCGEYEPTEAQRLADNKSALANPPPPPPHPDLSRRR